MYLRCRCMGFTIQYSSVSSLPMHGFDNKVTLNWKALHENMPCHHLAYPIIIPPCYLSFVRMSPNTYCIGFPSNSQSPPPHSVAMGGHSLAMGGSNLVSPDHFQSVVLRYIVTSLAWIVFNQYFSYISKEIVFRYLYGWVVAICRP